MLTHENLPKKYWGEAVNIAVHLTNRLPTSALGGKITPHEKWTGKTPDLGHVRVFGSVCYANTPTVGRRKLDAQARNCVFVGYSHGTAGYRLIDVKDMKLTIRRDVTFDETRLGFDSGSMHEEMSQEIAHFDQSRKGKANEHPSDMLVTPPEAVMIPPMPENIGT